MTGGHSGGSRSRGNGGGSRSGGNGGGPHSGGGAESRYPVRARRVYEAPSDDDGSRVLVDRLWPRGIKKEALTADEWCKDVAPSSDLRRWYGHKPERFAEFADRYLEELRSGDAAEAFGKLSELARRGPVTLLTATKDLPRSGAAVLADEVRRRAAETGGRDGGGKRPGRAGSRQ